MTTRYIGQPQRRVDGRAKVTGQAKYAGEHPLPDLAYGVVIASAIAKGRIESIDAGPALELPGVLQVFTHENARRTAADDTSYHDEVAPPGSPFRPLQDNQVRFSGQPIALAVAESFELARYAASLVHITYHREPHETDLTQVWNRAYQPKLRELIEVPEPRGNVEEALAKSAARIDQQYAMPAEHHNPMEPYATTVLWERENKLTIYDKTQGAQNNQQYVCKVFGLPGENVRLLSPFVGGAFGSGLRPQYQLFLAVLAALELKHSVRVTLTRQQMFGLGRRPQSVQRVVLGAAKNGRLEAVHHEAFAETSRFEDYTENIVVWSDGLYQCQNARLDYELAQLDLSSPCDMRAPGAATGLFALESAMDELAYKLELDPLELRLKNYAKRDATRDKPYSSKALLECYRQGAERFGWSNRSAPPRSMHEVDHLVGWGMATGVWDAFHFPASAKARLTADGQLTVSSATADIGTGTYTIMTQIAAETLGLPLEKVTFQLGDSSLSQAPVEGGSFTAASVGSAVKAACEKVGQKLLKLAQKREHSPLANARLKDVVFADGYIHLASEPSRRVALTEAMSQATGGSLEAEASVVPDEKKHARYTSHTHSAIFAEVKVDEALGAISVTRVVTAVAAGRILNPKTARSQIMGGIVWGIGMALEEASVLDQEFGRIINHNLAEYHVPVNADVHDVEVIFVEEQDKVVNPLGVKGVGEIGIVGVAAAIANAVFHATGTRVRELPITLDKLLLAPSPSGAH